jgi:membrane-associated phospholipid phosphatase
MVYDRIAKDPGFARDASEWLMSLAQITTRSLQHPASEEQEATVATATNMKPAPNISAQASVPEASPLAGSSATDISNRPIVGQEGEAANPTPNSSPSNGSPKTVATSAASYSDASFSTLKVSELPKYLLEEQKAFWTLPSRLRVPSLAFFAPATIGTAVLIGSDTAIERRLPTSTSLINHAATASTAGALALVGVGGGLFLAGQAKHNEHQRETGLLVGEAAIDAYGTSTAFQYITQRERPFTGNNKGTFFYGGNSFPSNTAAVAWSSASVIAHEYPGFLTKLLVYGAAGGVSAGRVIGHKHWTSDAVLGSALGWYMGLQVYRARGSGAEISAANWGSFEKAPEDKLPDPAYMGTTYVPLDSWVYPLFDRLAAQGYLPSEITAIRPWPRLECARLVLEAEETLRDNGVEDRGAAQTVKALRDEFTPELANLEGASNVGVELDSAYARITAVGGRALRDSFNFAQTLYNDYGRPYGQGFNTDDGAAVRAEAGPLAFYFRGEFQHSASLPNYTSQQAQQIVLTNDAPVLPISSVPTFNSVNQFSPIETYAALNIANWQISFGYQSYWWGPDRGTSLMFSDNAISEPMLKFGRVVPYQFHGPLFWLGKVRNTAFAGILPGYHFLRGPYPTFPVVGNPYQTINPLPYTWGDRLALKMTQNFEIGVGLSVIWAGQGRPATLHTWLHTFNGNGSSQTNNPGKRYTGFDFSYRLPKMRDWVTFYVDGMANDQPNPIAYYHQSAWNPGLYFPKLPYLPNLELRIEGVYTNLINYPGIGEYYKNIRYAQGYTIYNQIIGSWVGRQGDGIQALSTYWFSPRNKLQLGYRRQWVDKVLLEGGGLNDFSASVDWLFKHYLQLSSTVQYERWNFPFLGSTAVNNVSTQIQLMFTPTPGRLVGVRH